MVERALKSDRYLGLSGWMILLYYYILSNQLI